MDMTPVLNLLPASAWIQASHLPVTFQILILAGGSTPMPPEPCLTTPMADALTQVPAHCIPMPGVLQETYGAMAKTEKIAFILEQVRLCLDRGDYVRSGRHSIWHLASVSVLLIHPSIGEPSVASCCG